ncbi:MAG: hypothetical protein JNL70_20540 [Saprospiraceae bacterium]|nr:hypothetical protein [Saprospiraceae bacterium]
MATILQGIQKNRFYIFLCFFIGFWGLQACGKKSLRDYYFPLKQLKEQSKVYEYQFSTADTTLKIYWYYQVVIQGDSVYLVGNCYDAGFHPLMLMREEQVANGMKLKELIYYGVNQQGFSTKTTATIEGGAVFPFQVQDDKSVFVNVIKYSDLKDSTITTTLTRNRRFLKETTYDFKGKQLDAAEFEMKEEQSEKDPKRGGWVHVYNIQELYAKNIGLIYSKRTLNNGLSFETKLVDIYTMSELEEKFKRHLNESKQ